MVLVKSTTVFKVISARLYQAHWICEKGLSVGHSRINNLGSPVKGECF